MFSLQNHRHAKYIGLTSIYDFSILDLKTYDSPRGESFAGLDSFRKVAPDRFYYQSADTEQPDHARDTKDADEIEQLVAPHGEALIKLYFRIVHPSYPILHKKVYLEKYSRTHREFSPPLLAAVYILALNWWSYSSELTRQTKPDVARLEALALSSLRRVSKRAKLSTVQAALLLAQRPTIASWQLSCSIVGVAQDLGLHLDCSRWRIPLWERGLRKRLAWAVFMQDTWSALVHGRPPHLTQFNWTVQAVNSNDFPESAADEDGEDGSTEVEKGRSLFSAMISVTMMLSEVLRDLCSLKAEVEVDSASNPLKVALAQAKAIQLKLRSWYVEIPESLKIDMPTKIGKLNSTGSLQLAYLAVEMTIHRRIISSLHGPMVSHQLHDDIFGEPGANKRKLSTSNDPYLVSVCQSAAKSRLTTALDFVSRLKSEHLQSFWYFGSSFNFALIGSFAGLCLITAPTTDEGEFYRTKLLEYKWQLRVWSSSLEVLEKAAEMLNSAVEPLLTTSTTTVSPVAYQYPQGMGKGVVTNDEDLSDDDMNDEEISGTEEEIVLDHARYDQIINQLLNETAYSYIDTQVHT